MFFNTSYSENDSRQMIYMIEITLIQPPNIIYSKIPLLRSLEINTTPLIKGNAIYVVSISWSKRLNKPFILMREFSKLAPAGT